eukprot:TRINITY_DN20178_c0_g2_i1.p2 TRINITY_DN20178_c0_g2~~TRINITY_DN20178_c0_g2_i1.p2  ORF type:complete len:360 (+),score=93.11 TRINITY_DN20178_c0_g2_i1:79-1080(+)
MAGQADESFSLQHAEPQQAPPAASAVSVPTPGTSALPSRRPSAGGGGASTPPGGCALSELPSGRLTWQESFAAHSGGILAPSASRRSSTAHGAAASRHSSAAPCGAAVSQRSSVAADGVGATRRSSAAHSQRSAPSPCCAAGSRRGSSAAGSRAAAQPPGEAGARRGSHAADSRAAAQVHGPRTPPSPAVAQPCGAAADVLRAAGVLRGAGRSGMRDPFSVEEHLTRLLLELSRTAGSAPAPPEAPPAPYSSPPGVSQREAGLAAACTRGLISTPAECADEADPLRAERLLLQMVLQRLERRRGCFRRPAQCTRAERMEDGLRALLEIDAALC